MLDAEDEVRLYEDGWKDRYFRSKFDVSAGDHEFRRKVKLKFRHHNYLNEFLYLSEKNTIEYSTFDKYFLYLLQSKKFLRVPIF